MADKGSILSHDEVLELPSERPPEGSISAAIALERALRAAPRSDDGWDDELSHVLDDQKEAPARKRFPLGGKG